jgi:hypothetical protein
MKGNKITSSLSVHAGEIRTPGKKYGLDWGTYQATGGYKPSSKPHNPTPSDKSQEHKPVPKVGEVYKSIPNRTKTNIYKQTRYGG